MCGICGLYDYKRHEPADIQVLNNMLQVLHHRGRDDCGVYLDKDLALGMRRLSIIDLEGGKQPIPNEDGTIRTIFNGEIYNYRELREQLESEGHTLATKSDTEVIVEFAASLPPSLKVKGLARKYLPRKVAKAWIPREIIHRKKKGFSMPFTLWFRKEARSFLRDALSPATVRRRGLFNPGFVEDLLDEHETGFANHGSLLWGLLSVELWHRSFLDSPFHSQQQESALLTSAR
jgi:asparagine synthetase B (glutamine-hydrolysing)